MAHITGAGPVNPIFPISSPSLEEITKNLKDLGPEGKMDPNTMIKRVASFISTWWDAKLAGQVFYVLSYMLERLGSSNQSIEITALQNCFTLAMQRPSYWTSRQMEMLRHIKIQLDKLSSDVVTRNAAAGITPVAPSSGPVPLQSRSTELSAVPAPSSLLPPPAAASQSHLGPGSASSSLHVMHQPPARPLGTPPAAAPPVAKAKAPVAPPKPQPPSPAAATNTPPTSGLKPDARQRLQSNFIELFYSQMDAMNSNLFDVHDRMVILERRLAHVEVLSEQMSQLRKDINRLRQDLMGANLITPGQAGHATIDVSDDAADTRPQPQQGQAQQQAQQARKRAADGSSDGTTHAAGGDGAHSETPETKALKTDEALFEESVRV